MKNRYEGLFILNIKGNEEGAKEVIERLEGEFKTEGARIESVQKMDRRQFTYVAGPLESGYYVNFIFAAEPDAIEKLQNRFKLDEQVYRQHYQKLATTQAKPARVRTEKPEKVEA